MSGREMILYSPFTIGQYATIERNEMIEQQLQSDQLHKLKRTLVQLVEEKVHWKQEWKDAVHNLADNARLTKEIPSSTTTTLLFVGVSDICAVIARDSTINWCWTSSSGDGEIILVFGERFFKPNFRSKFGCSSLPYNLWFLVLNAIHQGLDAWTCNGLEQLPFINEPSFIFIPAQHFNADYTDGRYLLDIPNHHLDQSTLRPQFVADKWIDVGRDYLCKDSGEILLHKVFPNLATTINQAQMTRFINLYFRHDRKKRDTAANWMWQFLWNCGSITNDLSSDKRASVSRCIQHPIPGQSLRSYQAKLRPMITETLFIGDHFDLEEFTNFIKWIYCLKSENEKLMNLFRRSSSSHRHYYQSYESSTSSGRIFPGLDDDFSDPNNLRGKLANSSILHAMNQFSNTIERVQTGLFACYTLSTTNLGDASSDPVDETTDDETDYADEKIATTAVAKIPLAVIVIITDYLPFPQAPAPEYQVYKPIIDDVD